MGNQQLGRLTLIQCQNFSEAETQAGREAANTMGTSIPVVIFRQGSRTHLVGALPFLFIKTRLDSESAAPKARIGELTRMLNRPMNDEHAEAITRYIKENCQSKYILPPLTLNIQQEARLYTAESQSFLQTGFLVIPMTATISITDGQHRRKGILKAIEELEKESPEKAQALRTNGIAVMITCETDPAQNHQDFADCSKTKPLSPSQLAIYDRRNPANGLVIEIEEKCRLFTGRIDATSTRISKKSPSLFLANHIRQLVKVLFTGSWQMADAEFEKQAIKQLSDSKTYQRVLNQFVEYINYLTDKIPVWKQISELGTGVEIRQIEKLRDEGYVCLSVTGLVIIANIGHILFRDKKDDWKDYAAKLAEINWRKDAEIWQGNIIVDGKDRQEKPTKQIISQQRPVKTATEEVKKAIGLKKNSDSNNHQLSLDMEAYKEA